MAARQSPGAQFCRAKAMQASRPEPGSAPARPQPGEAKWHRAQPRSRQAFLSAACLLLGLAAYSCYGRESLCWATPLGGVLAGWRGGHSLRQLFGAVLGPLQARGPGGGRANDTQECAEEEEGPLVNPDAGVGVCQLSGRVRDCACDYAAVERLNRDELHPLLTELVQQPFFRYFKVNLYCDCPYWPNDGQCMLRDCSVCECEEGEVPKPFLAPEPGAPGAGGEGVCTAGEGALEAAGAVDRSVDAETRAALARVPGWRLWHNPWVPEEGEGMEYAYVNLLKNPEKYTGYKGEHAHRVWRLIYSQSCFEDVAGLEACPERRIFYRLVSGMHASISAHIARDYLVDEAAGRWGTNLALFRERLGTPARREHVENLYFAYLFVLRAALKAGPYLAGLGFDTGHPAADARTAALVAQLVGSPALRAACPVPFDEGRLWKGAGAAELQAQLQAHFRNITSAMDCVGCEKCKLWGKLQMLGIATSLRILFSSEDCGGPGSPQGLPPGLALERNEVIALLNLLERLSQSIETVRELSLELQRGAPDLAAPQSGLGAIEGVTLQSLAGMLGLAEVEAMDEGR